MKLLGLVAADVVATLPRPAQERLEPALRHLPDVRDHPLVQATLRAFPGSYIIHVITRRPEA